MLVLVFGLWVLMDGIICYFSHLVLVVDDEMCIIQNSVFMSQFVVTVFPLILLNK